MKSPVYTRTGDSGMTSLVDGSRQKKNCKRIEAYGTVDELNSVVGVLIASHPLEEDDCLMLTRIQNILFDIGSYLAAGSSDMAARLLPRLQTPLEQLEAEIDRLDASLPRHNRFILPQGTASCAYANMARSVARRAERRILDFADTPEADSQGGVDPDVLRYINRLSDYLFVLSRHCNHIASHPEIYWDNNKS